VTQFDLIIFALQVMRKKITVFKALLPSRKNYKQMNEVPSKKRASFDAPLPPSVLFYVRPMNIIAIFLPSVNKR